MRCGRGRAALKTHHAQHTLPSQPALPAQLPPRPPHLRRRDAEHEGAGGAARRLVLP